MSNITVSTADFRPCIVDGVESMSHRLEDKYGIVMEVPPEEIRFINNTELFERYCKGNFDCK